MKNNALSPKPLGASRVTLSQLMHLEHANLLGNVHGGWIMKLVDEAGALACMRHAQCKVVTVAIDSMTFREPIKIGDLVILNAEVTYTGRTSMEAKVDVLAENPLTRERSHTNTAYLVYVALDDEGKPMEIPQLMAENEEETQKLLQAKERQERRLKEKKLRESQ
ncbi:MAG: acyl-CoA thioesterase [Anaerolineales bacterium]